MRSGLCFLFAFVALLSAEAQNEFVVVGSDGTNPTVYIKGDDGTNPTLFINGSFTNDDGSVENDSSRLDITGDWTNTPTSTGSGYRSTGQERFRGDGISRVSGVMNGTDTATVGGEIGGENQFHDLVIDKNTAAAYLELDTDVHVDSAGTLTFASNGRVRTDILSHGADGGAYAHELFVRNASPTSTSISGAAATGGAGDAYVEGRLRVAVGGSNDYSFPIGIEPGVVDGGSQPFELSFVTADSSDIVGFFRPSTTSLNNAGVVFHDVGEDPDGSAINDLTECVGPADGFLDRIDLNIHQAHEWVVERSAAGTTFDYAITVDPSASADVTATDASIYGCNNEVLLFLAKDGNVGGDGVAVTSDVQDWPGVPGFETGPTGYTLSGQTSFSSFDLHSVSPSNVQLPVELLSIQANGIDDSFIRVEWATASEQDNAGFEVQRSVDGLLFEPIGWVDGHGTTSSPSFYTFDNVEVHANTRYYYRLKQVDLNGAFDLSPVVWAMIGSESQLESILHPNPTRSNATLEIRTDVPRSGELAVFDLMGKKVFARSAIIEPGVNRLPIPSLDWASGVYHVQFRSTFTTIQHRLIVER